MQENVFFRLVDFFLYVLEISHWINLVLYYQSDQIKTFLAENILLMIGYDLRLAAIG